MRAKYEVEREVDRALTRKLEKRSGPPHEPVSIEAMVAGLRSMISAQHDGDFEISNARWLGGGASKLQMGFTIDWSPDSAGRRTEKMILRTDLAESLHATSRLREYQIVQALQGTIPTPSTYWVDNEGHHLPYPGLVYSFERGVAKPADAQAGVSGLGTKLPNDLRKQLAPQFIEHLAKLHTFDFSNAELPAFDVPKLGTQNSEWAVNWWDRVFEEDAEEEVPLVALASAWLHKNTPDTQHLSIVHGDYRVGNFLYDESTNEITTWLDWELARIGDRHQDLAWSSSHAFAAYADDGMTLLVSGLLPEDEFFEAYEKASGLGVDLRTLHYYKVFNAYAMVAMTLGTAYRVARNGKSHQDILQAWLLGVGYLLLDNIRELIEEAG
jgi:aminoglycoside phosphotransferase (APT) family kinase protein